MVNYLNKTKWYLQYGTARQKLLVMNLLVVLLLLSSSSGALAHSPHDDCFDIQVSPRFQDDRAVFAIVRSNLLVSRDSGETWQRRVRGLSHKHMLYSLSIANDGKTIYLASLGDGVFRSIDAGESWQQTNQGLESSMIDLVAVSPDSSNLVFAAGVTGRLYRSETGGGEWIAIGEGMGKINAVEFAAGVSSLVFAGDSSGQIHQSSDSGRSWKVLHKTKSGKAITALAIHKFTTDKMFVVYGTQEGEIGISSDSGQIFNTNKLSDASEPVMDIVIPSINSLYATLWDGGVYRSDDNGMSWHESGYGLTRDRQSERLGRPSFSKLAISPSFSNDATLFVAGYDGLFRSVDKGNDWSELETLSSLNIMGLSLSPDYVHDDTLVFTNWLWGAYLSPDKGKSWKEINRGTYEHFTRENGIVRLFDVVFSPDYKNDKTLFSSTWYRFLKSLNNGREWQQIMPLKDGTWGKTHHGQVVVVSPDYKNDQTIFIGTHRGVLMKSTDSGETFQVVLDIKHLIGDVVVSPDYAEDHTLFVSDTRGVHLSHDKGMSWRYVAITAGSDENILISPTYPAEAVDAWRKHQQFERAKAYSIKLAISPSFAEDQTLFAGTAEGLYVSDNQGLSWQKLSGSDLSANAFVETASISPDYAKDRTMLLSVRGQGVLQSRDGGKTFHVVAKEMINKNVLFAHYIGIVSNFGTIVFSPTYAEDQTIYAFSGPKLFRSSDVGESWKIISTPKPGVFKRKYVQAAYHFSYLKRSRKFWVMVIMIVVLPGYVTWRVAHRRKL